MLFYTILIIIIFIIVICITITYLQNNTNTHYSYMHSKENYPCMKYVFDNRKTIIEEFYKNILNNTKWSNWMEYDKVANTPIFTKMTPDEIISRMKENSCKLNEGKPSWKIYGLMLYGNPLVDNIKDCPKTMDILSQCPNIVNAGFSCLEPNVITSLHHDFNHDIVRCHIPVIIPKGNTAINIDNNVVKWDENDYFIFDDTYDHQAWNYTKNIRIVLILDIIKNKH